MARYRFPAALIAAALGGATVMGQVPPRVDTSPHKEARVVVNAVGLQYLDWGGTGDVVLLLAGLGNDAHIFDSFAPGLTDRWHVIGLTRRGFGGSDKPAGGYTNAVRVEDIRQFLAALKIPRAHLVGHSLAGDEMALFASLYPERVGRLVFLDAAYNRAGSLGMGLTAPASTDAARTLIQEALGPPAAVTPMMVALLREMNEFRPEFSRIQSPALSIYVVNERDPSTPAQADADTRRRFEAWWTEQMLPWQRARIEEFRLQQPRAEVVEIRNASHFVFLGATQKDIVARVREFLAQ